MSEAPPRGPAVRLRPLHRHPSAHPLAAMGGGDDHVGGAPPRPRIGITTALTVSFGGLVFLAVAAVLFIVLAIARQNTLDLLSDKATLSVDHLASELRHHLDPVYQSNVRLAEMIGRGDADPADRVAFGRVAAAALTATPQVGGLGYFDVGGSLVRVPRLPGSPTVYLSDWTANPEFAAVMREAESQSAAEWGPPIWSDEAGTTLVNLRSPVRRDGRLIGVLVSVVAVDELSRFIWRERPPAEGMRRFILYGRDHVLAHPAIAQGRLLPNPDRSLPRLDEVGDKVLAALWDDRARRALFIKLPADAGGRMVAVDGHQYIVLFRALQGYGSVPLLVGGYLGTASQDILQEIRRLVIAGAAGLAILIAAVFAALWIGRRMGEPLERVAQAARHVRRLDLDHVPRLRRSRMRELDEAAVAFNAMVGGLRWFENYVPRTLVRRLLAEPAAYVPESSEQAVTIMFTDIANFTGLAQQTTAAEAADLLNAHFALLGACVDAEDGTIDKYIGDSLMAFWGPPAAELAHAERACRAALAIRAAVAADNAARRDEGLEPIRVRIGIHTGSAIVGNIGAPGRINYTLVGDTVNVAQRLQEIGKVLGDPGTDVDILLSRDTADALRERHVFRSYGQRPIRGREGEIEVLRLVTPEAALAPQP